MAGFQDQLIAPAPYRETIPVDAYTKVGMIKQQQYDQGVEKVQGMIDSVAGIDALMPEQKDYLNKAVNQLQSQVSTLASQDFSNQQIVNSVGHLTGQIANDPVIQNTIYSTNAYRNESSKMKQAQESGKSSPANEYVFQSQFAKWMQSGDPSKTFNATYTPYTDYKGKMIKALNDKLATTPDEVMTEMPFKRGANGQVITDDHGQPILDYNTLIEKYKGVSAEKIRNILESTLDENDKQQMSIDGQYEYRGAGKGQMKDLTDRSYQSRLEKVNGAIQGLQVKRSTSQADPQALKEIDNQLAYLNDTAKNLQQGYLRDIDHINTDNEGYKSSLYAQNWLSKFSEGYSYAQHSLSYGDNPAFKNALSEREANLKFEEFKANKDFQYAQLGIERDKLGVEMYKAGLKSKFGQLPNQQGLGGAGSVPEPITNPDHLTTEAEFITNLEKDKNTSELAGIALLASKTKGLVKKVFDKDGNASFEWEGGTVAEKNKNITTGLATLETYRQGKGGNDPDIQAWINSDKDRDMNYKNGRQAIIDAEANADSQPQYNVNTKINSVKPIVVNGVSISAKDQVLFNDKVDRIVEESGGNNSHGYINPEAVNKYISTTQDKAMWEQLQHPLGEGANLANQLSNVRRTVNEPNKDVLRARDRYIANQLKSILPVQEPVSTPLQQFKGPDKESAQNFAKNVFVALGEKENTGLNYDKSDIAKMLDEKNIKGTDFYLIDRGDGKYALRYSNTGVIGGKKMEVDLTPDLVNNVFGGSLGADMFKTIREMQNYSKLSNGVVTTNVRRGGSNTALSLNNGNIHNYDVKYDVERGSNGTGQQIRLYIYDKTTKQETEKMLRPGQMLSEGETLAALQALNDDTINTTLKDDAK